MTHIDQTSSEIATQIATLDAEREYLFAQKSPIDARLVTIRNLRSKLTDEIVKHLDPTTDVGLESLWRAAWDGGLGNHAAKKSLEEYARSFAPEVYGVQWQRVSDDVYPTPILILTRGQDVSALSIGLLDLIRKLAAGRETVSVHLLEHTASEHGSYGIDVTVATGEAVFHVMRYYHRADMVTGSLADALAGAARYAWYEKEVGATDDDDDDDDDRG